MNLKIASAITFNPDDYTELFTASITNVLRCLQLEARGYQVTVTELVGWEHSMKNELIIARKVARYKDSARKRQLDIMKELGLEDMTERFAY